LGACYRDCFIPGMSKSLSGITGMGLVPGTTTEYPVKTYLDSERVLSQMQPFRLIFHKSGFQQPGIYLDIRLVHGCFKPVVKNLVHFFLHQVFFNDIIYLVWL